MRERQGDDALGPMPELRPSYLVGRVHRMLQTELEEVLASAGVSLPELVALSVLMSRPGLSNARLARRCLVTPHAMHRVSRSLEQRGLVSRAARRAGGRDLQTAITAAGAAVLAELQPRLQEVEDRVLVPLEPSERADFIRMLRLVSKLDESSVVRAADGRLDAAAQAPTGRARP